jgi:hypothetical protein
MKKYHSLAAVILVALLAQVFLGAPCSGGGPTTHTFNVGSIVIPMDQCYQKDTSGTPSIETVNCNATGDQGVFRAYGLVYLLVRNGVTVYWVINKNKTAVTDIDFTLTVAAAPVANQWDWGTNAFDQPMNQTTINYRGGPFVIDSADAPTVIGLLSSTTTNSDFHNFQATGGASMVNLHQIEQGFTANNVRPLTGMPPKVAILSLPTQVYSQVMYDYVIATGLSSIPNGGGVSKAYTGGNCCGGTNDCTGSGNPCCTNVVNPALNNGPGSIYDVLCAGDFSAPPAGGNAALIANGYKLLWAPHWDNLANPAGATAADQHLATWLGNISQFVTNGNNVLAECSSATTLEGGPDGAGTKIGTAGTRFQTTNQFQSTDVASTGGNQTDVLLLPTDPNMQIGDFPYALVGGYLTDFYPSHATNPPSVYNPNVNVFINQNVVGTGEQDIYTRIRKDSNNNEGLVVYLGGHDYCTNGNGNCTQTAGTRLVLNSLFNLGIPCADPNTPCNTGQPGVCAQGTLKCAANGGLTCVPITAPSPEICDGLDNDCNGIVDDLPTCPAGTAASGTPPICTSGGKQCNDCSCYDGTAGTENNPPCHGGTEVCVSGTLPDGGPTGNWVCQGEVTPGPEICNGIDDNCDGIVDNLPTCPAGTQATVGICVSAGAQCNGCGCYDGPPGTVNVPPCQPGTESCVNGSWGMCVGEVTPTPTATCSAPPDGGAGCADGGTLSCYTGPANTLGVGVCKAGTATCIGTIYGPCVGEVTPQPAACNGLDNTCTGQIGGPCPAGLICRNGVCVPASCGGELNVCPPGYACVTSGDGGCEPTACGSGDAGICAPGLVCSTSGVCANLCTNVKCGTGSTCSAGVCVAGGCYATGCPTGQICQQGSCVANPCTSVQCPVGTFCRQGDCVQSCGFVQCPSGQVCSIDGFCVAGCQPACGTGQVCVSGTCQTDPCAGLSCAMGQVCQGGNCVDDPCDGVQCPYGACVNGQCSTPPGARDGGAQPGNDAGNMNGGGDAGGSTTKPGCGCASSSGFEVLAFLGLAVFLRRRRSPGLAVEAAMTKSSCPSRRLSPALASAAVMALGLVAMACGGNGGSDAGNNGNPDGSSRCTSGQTNCATGCTDLASDPLNCGSCGNACSAAQSCAGGSCAGFNPVNPFISSLTPTTVAAGPAKVTFQVTGQRFASGATLRLTGGGLSGAHPLTIAGPTSASLANLDVSGATPGSTVIVRVVDPPLAAGQGDLISNAVAVIVTGTVGTDGGVPTLVSISPTIVPAGYVGQMNVTGTGFFGTSMNVQMSGGGLTQPVNNVGAVLSGTTIYVGSFNLGGAGQGTYNVGVTYSGGQTNTVPLAVQGTQPSITSVSPTQGERGATVSITITGTNFDSTSTATITSASGTATPITPLTLGGTTTLTASLNLTSLAAGNYGITVQNSGKYTSNAVGFLVLSNNPSLISVAPPAANEDQTAVGLTLTGSGFQNGATVSLTQGTTSNTIPAAGVTVTNATTIQITGLNVTGYALGVWTVVVTNPGSNPSAGVTFTVDPGTPVLTGISPAMASQSAMQPTTATLTGNYFYSTSTVYASGGSLPDGGSPLPTSGCASSTLPCMSITATADVSQVSTGTYSIWVVNPGAPPLISGAQTFTVTP